MQIPFRKKPIPEGRRRTTAASRPQIYSYHASRSSLPEATGRQIARPVLTKQQATHALSYSMRRFGVIAIGGAVLVSLISVLTLSPDPKIQPLNASTGSFLHSTATYQQAATKLLADSPGSRTKLTINTGAIGNALRRQFPDLAIVSVKLPLIGHRPVIYIQPIQPALVLSTLHSGQFVVSTDGHIAGSATAATANDLHVPLVIDQSGAAVSVGQAALPTSTVSFIQAVAYQLRQKQVGVTAFTLPPGSGELDATITDTPYFVKFNLENPASTQQQIGTFLAIRHYLQGQGTQPAQYIDVRVDGRGYYK